MPRGTPDPAIQLLLPKFRPNYAIIPKTKLTAIDFSQEYAA